MTAKQKRFAEEYLVDLNATQAAIRAGYSPESAGVIGSENLKKPEIRARIDKGMAELSKRTGINQERVIRELAKVAFVNMADVVDFDTAKLLPGATADDTAAIASVRIKTTPNSPGLGAELEIRTADKLKALELLGKHLGMFTDKLKLEGAVPVVITGDDQLED